MTAAKNHSSSPSKTVLSSTSEDDIDRDHNGGGLFSIDLETRCVKHFEFLKTLHEAGVTRRLTSESLRRYRLWLDMLGKMRMNGLTTRSVVPPKDVAWLWHCHRLAPEKYKEYLEHTSTKAAATKTRGTRNIKAHLAMLDWKDPAGDPYALEVDAHSRKTWAKYNPSESFDLDPAQDEKAAFANHNLPNETLLDFDLLKSAQSQAEFFWQIQPLFRS
jgi:hypothetical protein